MKIHEYQAKQILKAYGVAVPEGRVVDDPAGAGAAFTELGGELAVVKAQIHAGGRGKGGGVKLVRSADEAKEAAAAIQSKPLITHQTGPNGQPVKTLLVEAGSKIANEYYVGIALDRSVGLPVVMASSEGGVEIEQVAQETPEKILKEPLDPMVGLMPYQARRLAKGIGLRPELWNKATLFFHGLCRAYLEKDMSLAEINPLVVTEDGEIIALDGKMNFDGSGLYRNPDVSAMRDLDEEDATEVEAGDAGLSYVNLDGNIGCLVNGAGLAMATMDLIKLHGGEPANFLDVGGGATKEQVATAFRIILKDPAVKGILVNIFGGILRCTTLAEGIVAAAKEIAISVPLVVRLEGTEVADGRKILEESDVAIITATDMTDAANKIVEAAGAAS
ncbi:MAG: ADP-forming succinate--CoA ligase subunit beta [Deltaproteobacteria bacterium]|nr:ADP-forming succinate--CoA ligase subunit beta [Deltaproteobacteria bacterium]